MSGTEAAPVSFRLPCPPRWDDRPPAAWAAERRARRAYFAALDALRTGQVCDVERQKLARFMSEVRNPDVRERLEHLRRVLDFALARAGAAATITDRPDTPFTRLELTVPAPRGLNRPQELERRFDWALEWLRTRGYVAGRDLRIDWRVQPRAVIRAQGGSLATRPGNRAPA